MPTKYRVQFRPGGPTYHYLDYFDTFFSCGDVVRCVGARGNQINGLVLARQLNVTEKPLIGYSKIIWEGDYHRKKKFLDEWDEKMDKFNEDLRINDPDDEMHNPFKCKYCKEMNNG